MDLFRSRARTASESKRRDSKKKERESERRISKGLRNVRKASKDTSKEEVSRQNSKEKVPSRRNLIRDVSKENHEPISAPPPAAPIRREREQNPGSEGDLLAGVDANNLRVMIPKNLNLLSARKTFRESGMKTSDFKWMATVGKGTFGNVKMVQLTPQASEKIYSNGCPKLPRLAIKTMKKKNIIQMDQVEHIKHEVSILSSLDHPFIIALYGVMHDSTRLFLLMEYIRGGELFSLLANFNCFNFEQTRFYAAEVTLAFEYLHARKIAYRDLKPENILLDANGHIKIADFGFAKIIDQRSWTICGTPEYIAPEIIMAKGHSTGVDWWGLGVLIYEMVTGQPPFVHENTMVLYKIIQEVQFKFPRTIDIRTKDLIRRLLVKDITRRYGCLKGGADDIKRHKFFRGLIWQELVDGVVTAPWKPEMSDKDPANKYFDHYDESLEPPETITSTEQAKYFSWFDNW